MSSSEDKSTQNDTSQESLDTDQLVSHDSTREPKRIGRYAVQKVLGRGGFGQVYLAHDDQLQRLVAIKVPHTRLVARPEDAELYLAEARTVAGLDHPHIVPVYDVGQTKEFPCYFVSKFVDGKTLCDHARESCPTWREAAELVATIADALHYSHQRGLVHRDVKPGNILLDSTGTPHIVDFGLALKESDVGKGPRYAGTPAYMSPEQAEGKGQLVDGRSDVFSLGVVLYELLTGRRPFVGHSLTEITERIRHQEARPPRQIVDMIPLEIERICLMALTKAISDRYTTAKDFADDLRRFLANSPTPEAADDLLHRKTTSATVRVKFAHRLMRARTWQDRPALDELCRWWLETDSGVCALIGIGGAGKTSLVERFLWLIPGLLPARPDIVSDSRFTPPSSMFVFSFFEAPGPDAFFQQLADWLDESATAENAATYDQVLGLLERSTEPRLLVLDGLEKAQADAFHGRSLGQISDSRLRDLILRLSDGLLPGCRAVVTTRYAPVDPVVHGCPFFRPIRVEQLTPTAAVALLRARGVCGSDSELENLAKEYGFHALSVDLLGGYLAKFFQGQPRAVRSLPGFQQTRGSALGDHLMQSELLRDASGVVLHEQEARFEQIAQGYRDLLAEHDPAALALLERVCLFRLGARSDTLANIFLGPDKELVSGRDLSALDHAGLENRLSLLVDLHLLEASAPNDHPVYTIHPAVRDSFLRGVEQSTARHGHEAVRSHLLTTIPATSLHSADSATLDVLEETIFHTIQAGEVEEAWRMYSAMIGGYEVLGRRRGLYQRGDRICRMFRDLDPKMIRSHIADEARTELALYSRNLGRLEAAIELQQELIGKSCGSRRAEGMQVLAHLLFLRGRLRQSAEIIESALAGSEHDLEAQEACLSVRAHVRALQGQVQQARDDFEATRKVQQMIDGTAKLYASRGVFYGDLLLRLGRLEEAASHTRWNRQTLTEKYGSDHQHVASCNLLLASILRRTGDLVAARQCWAAGHDWALTREAKEHLCWAALVGARIGLAEAKSSPVAAGDEVANMVQRGLRIARECGFSVHHVDLLLVRCWLQLQAGRPEDAERDARTALFGLQIVEDLAQTYQARTRNPHDAPSDRGIFPPANSGCPDLLAAAHPDFGYAWGAAEGRELFAQALLQQTEVVGDLDQGARQTMLKDAAQQLHEACTLWGQMGVAPHDTTQRKLNEITVLLDRPCVR